MAKWKRYFAFFMYRSEERFNLKPVAVKNIDMERDDFKTYILAAAVILFWLVTPLYLQLEHGYSAVKASFLITIIYYIGFKAWKWRSK